MKREKIILVGGGGHCRSVIDVIERQGQYEIHGIIDKKSLIGTEVLGYKVIAEDNDLADVFKECPNAVVTVGQISSNDIRVKCYRHLKKIGYVLPVIVSPLAYVSKHAYIEEGSVIMHGAIVNASARIGKNCIINSKALVEHDSVIGDHVHISTGAIVNGGVNVQENTFYGSNATSKEGISASGFIKAGSVIK